MTSEAEDAKAKEALSVSNLNGEGGVCGISSVNDARGSVKSAPKR